MRHIVVARGVERNHERLAQCAVEALELIMRHFLHRIEVPLIRGLGVLVGASKNRVVGQMPSRRWYT